MEFHTYVKKEKTSVEEKTPLPSCIGLHEYAKRWIKAKSPKKRCGESSLEENPTHPSKQSCVSTRAKASVDSMEDNHSAKQPYISARWQDKEKEFLKEYMRTNPPLTPISNVYWREVAASLNKEFQTTRSGASCRSFHKREITPEETNAKNEDNLREISEKGTQTDISDFCSVDVGEHSMTDIEAEDQAIENIVERVKSQIKKLATSRKNGCSFRSLAIEIYGVKALKEEMWHCFMLDIEDSLNLQRRHYTDNVDNSDG